MELTEKTLKTNRIFEGRVINLRVDTVSLPDGKEAEREIVEHNGGVAVLAFDEDGKILTVKQYRIPYNEVTIEIPAGKLEIGENPEECGRRELHEETGYIAKEMELLFTLYPSPGYCSEKIYIYYAKNTEKADQKLDEDEYLDVCRYSVNELYKMLSAGEIRDAKTIAAVLKAKLITEGM